GREVGRPRRMGPRRGVPAEDQVHGFGGGLRPGPQLLVAGQAVDVPLGSPDRLAEGLVGEHRPDAPAAGAGKEPELAVARQPRALDELQHGLRVGAPFPFLLRHTAYYRSRSSTAGPGLARAAAAGEDGPGPRFAGPKTHPGGGEPAMRGGLCPLARFPAGASPPARFVAPPPPRPPRG